MAPLPSGRSSGFACTLGMPRLAFEGHTLDTLDRFKGLVENITKKGAKTSKNIPVSNRSCLRNMIAVCSYTSHCR